MALDCAVGTSTPGGEAMAHVLATFGQFERRLIGQRTKEALAAKKAAGTRLGRPPTVPQSVVRRIQRQRARRDSLRLIADDLNRDKVPTAQGGAQWYAATVSHVLLRALLALLAQPDPSPASASDRVEPAVDGENAEGMTTGRFQLLGRAGHSGFLELPWELPLEEWRSERLVKPVRGIGRHVVRFVEQDGRLYALKELPERIARREYTLLRRLEGQGLPVVEAVGLVTERGGDLDGVLITRHLDYSLPYRALFAGGVIPDLRSHLLNALVELIARLHLRGFFWGDCSLSNALFRRDAGALSAYLVDAETGELHGTLSDGQRNYDLELARTNVFGELLDVDAEVGLPPDVDPEETSAAIVEGYEALWRELIQEETFGPDERFRLDERLRRLNALGFDVDEIQLTAGDGGYRLVLDPHVVEPGHHRQRLLRLSGLDAQENQARRMLNDLARYKEALERREGRVLSDGVVASRWRDEVFEPTIAAVPEELRGRLEAAEVFHQVLEHRWFLSERAGKDVGIEVAVRSYVTSVLPARPAERVVLEEL